MMKKFFLGILCSLVIFTSCNPPVMTEEEVEEVYQNESSYIDGPATGRRIFPLGSSVNGKTDIRYGYLIVEWGVEYQSGYARTYVNVSNVISFSKPDVFEYSPGYSLGSVTMDSIFIRIDDTSGGSASQTFSSVDSYPLTLKGPFFPLSDNIEPNYLVVRATAPTFSDYDSVPQTTILDKRPRLTVYPQVVGEGSVTPAGITIHSGASPITIKADPVPGFKFSKWVISSDSGATIADPLSAVTTVSTRKGNTTVQALFALENEFGTVGPLSYRYIRNYAFAYNDRDTDAKRDVTVYRPVPQSGYYPVGYYAQGDYSSPTGYVLTVQGDVGAGQPLAYPIDYLQVWNDRGSGGKYDGAFWRPIAPSGYVALGGVITGENYPKPALTAVVCVRSDLVVPGKIGAQIWRDSGSGAKLDVSVWGIVPNADGMYSGCFFPYGSYSTPTLPVYVLKRE